MTEDEITAAMQMVPPEHREATEKALKQALEDFKSGQWSVSDMSAHIRKLIESSIPGATALVMPVSRVDGSAKTFKSRVRSLLGFDLEDAIDAGSLEEELRKLTAPGGPMDGLAEYGNDETVMLGQIKGDDPMVDHVVDSRIVMGVAGGDPEAAVQHILVIRVADHDKIKERLAKIQSKGEFEGTLPFGVNDTVERFLVLSNQGAAQSMFVDLMQTMFCEELGREIFDTINRHECHGDHDD